MPSTPDIPQPVIIDQASARVGNGAAITKTSVTNAQQQLMGRLEAFMHGDESEPRDALKELAELPANVNDQPRSANPATESEVGDQMTISSGTTAGDSVTTKSDPKGAIEKTPIGSLESDRDKSDITKPKELIGKEVTLRPDRKLTENELRRQYIVLKLYQQLGLPVPEVKLSDVDGQTVLVLSTNTVSHSDYISDVELAHRPDIQESALAHFFTSNGAAADWLRYDKHGKFIVWQPQWQTALGWGSLGNTDEVLPYTSINLHDFVTDSGERGKVLFGHASRESTKAMAERIATLDPTQIVSTVLEAGFTPEYSRKIIGILLRNQQEIKQHFYESASPIPEDSEEWLRLEEELEKSPGNRGLHDAINRATETNNALADYVRNAEQVEQHIASLGKSTTTSSVVATVEPVDRVALLTTVETINNSVTKTPHSLNPSEVAATYDEIAKAQRQITLLRRQTRVLGLIPSRDRELDQAEAQLTRRAESLTETWSEIKKRLPMRVRQTVQETGRQLLHVYEFESYGNGRREIMMGHPGYEPEHIVNVESNTGTAGTTLRKEFERLVFANLTHIGGEIPADYSGRITEQFLLDRFRTVPSLRQIQVLEQLGTTFEGFAAQLPEGERERAQGILSMLTGIAQKRRDDFKVEAEKMRHSVVSHSTPHRVAREVLRDGSLRSQLNQLQDIGVITASSPVGVREALPQIAFSIEGAENYGGRHGEDGVREEVVEREGRKAVSRNFNRARYLRGDNGQPVAFVSGYARAIEGRQFAQCVNTSGGNPHLPELHVFGRNFNETGSREGVQISVDDTILLVPEPERDEWNDFLSKPHGEGGAGKDADWISRHLQTYPSHLSLNTFIRLNRDELRESVGKPATGLFLATDNRAKVIPAAPVAPLFKWVAASE